MNWRWYFALLALLFVFYTALAGWVPPHDDELYYWCWSKELQLSYFDHPPLTAYMIRASTAVFGDTLFAVRLPACLATVVVLGVIGWLTRPRGILFATVFTPVYTFGAVVITPDTPLLLFWALYLAWLVAVHQRLTPADGSDPQPVRWPWWVAGGVLLGCGLLGKYTTGLAVPAGVLTFLLIGLGSVRRWLGGYLAHLAVAFAVTSPVLVYNLQHGFEPLLYQWTHATGSKQTGLKPLGEFVGVQVLLTGALPLLLLPWLAWRWKALSADPRLRVCACLYGLPTLFFTVKAISGPLEGNWALAGYLAFWPIAARWFEGLKSLSWMWRMRLRVAGWCTFLAPALSVAALGTHLVHPLPVIEPNKDRVTRLHERARVAEVMAEFCGSAGEQVPVFTPEYQWVALLRFHRVNAQQEPGVTRPSHFTQAGRRMTDYQTVYYFSNYPLPDGHAQGFTRAVLIHEFPLDVRGEHYDTYKLWLYRKADRTDPDSRVSANRPRP